LIQRPPGAAARASKSNAAAAATARDRDRCLYPSRQFQADDRDKDRDKRRARASHHDGDSGRRDSDQTPGPTSPRPGPCRCATGTRAPARMQRLHSRTTMLFLRILQAPHLPQARARLRAPGAAGAFPRLPGPISLYVPPSPSSESVRPSVRPFLPPPPSPRTQSLRTRDCCDFTATGAAREAAGRYRGVRTCDGGHGGDCAKLSDLNFGRASQ
jgi:hypothetical protein